jgi:hypothetical protein
MADAKNEIHDFEITVPDVSEMVRWAEENIPKHVQSISAHQLDDDRYRCRLVVRGGGEATALKMVFDNRAKG